MGLGIDFAELTILQCMWLGLLVSMSVIGVATCVIYLYRVRFFSYMRYIIHRFSQDIVKPIEEEEWQEVR